MDYVTGIESHDDGALWSMPRKTRGAVLFVPRLWISYKCLPLALAPTLLTTIRFSHGKGKSIYLNPALILKTHPGFKPVPSHWLHLASLSFPAVFLITPWLNPLPNAGALIFNHRLLQERPILCLYYSTIYPTLKDCSESEKEKERRHWRLFTISLIHREYVLVVQSGSVMRESLSLFRHLLTLLLYSNTFAALVLSTLHKLFQKSLLMECESERPVFSDKRRHIQENKMNKAAECATCSATNKSIESLPVLLVLSSLEHKLYRTESRQNAVINPFLCPWRDADIPCTTSPV